MGTGGPLEAAFTLAGPIGAGTWRLVADGIIIEDVDVRFELIWRATSGDDVLATWDHHFTAVPGDFRAQPFEATADVEPVGAAAGDRLVFRYASTGGATVAMAYTPPALAFRERDWPAEVPRGIPLGFYVELHDINPAR